MRKLFKLIFSAKKCNYLLTTDVLAVPAAVVTELKTMPQILSWHTLGVPFWPVMLLVLVAQGMMTQSVEQTDPTMLPCAMVPPLMLNDIAGVLAT